MSTTRLLVKRSNIAETMIEVQESAPLQDGQIRLRIENVALTANNISYAATGDMLQYWQFFPAEAPWACVPAWGFAFVTESLAKGVEIGEKLWGFLPMASEVVMEPVRVSGFGFTDGLAHRRALPHIYNEYTRCRMDPMHTEGQEDVEAILRPLFATGWLVDDFLEDKNFFAAKTIILSSASSKTAYGTAAQLARRKDLQIVGLTANRNLEFVKGLGSYTQVVSYDALDQLDASAACVYLDYAGDAELRRKLHTLLGNMTHSSSIGGSHVDKMGGSSGLPGPKPTFLFVPTQAAKRVAQWGIAGLMERMTRDWKAFASRATDAAQPWLVVQHHTGEMAVQAAYALVLAGKGDPRTGHMLSL